LLLDQPQDSKKKALLKNVTSLDYETGDVVM
jgi:hypothetical protein